jgi:hypothetical protein
VTLLLLAALETVQGICIAAFEGLNVIKREITKGQRKQEQAKKFEDSVRQDMERMT